MALIDYALYSACVVLMLSAIVTLLRRRMPTPTSVTIGVGIVAACSLLALGRASNAYPLISWVGMASVYVLMRSSARALEHAPMLLRYLGGTLAVFTIIETALTQSRPVWVTTPNLTGTLIMMCSPFMQWGWVGIIATGSRTALVGWLAARIRGLSLWLVFCGLALVLVALRPETITDRLQRYQACLITFSENRFGLGSGGWTALHPTEWHCDSLPVTVLVEHGVVGLMVFLVFVWLVIFGIRNPSPYRTALVGVAIIQLADFTLYFPHSALLLGVLLAGAENEF